MKVKAVALKFYARGNVGNKWPAENFEDIAYEIKERLLQVKKYSEKGAERIIKKVFCEYPKKSRGTNYKISGNKILLYNEHRDEYGNSWGYDECEMTIIFAHQKPLTKQLLNEAREIIKKCEEEWEVNYKCAEGPIKTSLEDFLGYKEFEKLGYEGNLVLDKKSAFELVEYVVNEIECYIEFYNRDKMGVLYGIKSSGTPIASNNDPYAWGYDDFDYEIDDDRIKINFSYVDLGNVYNEWVEFKKIEK